MTQDQKNEIILLIKEHIDEHGSCRVGWAAEKILGIKQQNHILDKISATILLSREYIKEPANPNFKYDWNIRKDPGYKAESWTERHPLTFEIAKAFITAIFTIAVSVTLSVIIIDNRDNQKNVQGTKEIPTFTADSLTVKKIKTDSTK
jgi:hypothetical protein